MKEIEAGSHTQTRETCEDQTRETFEDQTQETCEESRRTALEALHRDCTAENLWNCIVAFQGYPFYTSSGLPFSYALKRGRNGRYTRELFIDRRENSKSLAFSSVRLAFERAVEKKGVIVSRPKEIADVRGVSYSYSLLWRFGVISVPEEIEIKMRGSMK